MKNLKVISLLVALLSNGLALAEDVNFDVAKDVVVPTSTVSRAEVLADVYIWRASGLAELMNRETGPDTESPQYKQAHARYAQMRASPQFATLVAEIQQKGSARIVVSKR